jgi:hypothetical protein
MTTTTLRASSASTSRSRLRSAGALGAALIAMVLVTLVADQTLHWIGVFPPWGQPFYETGPYLLAVAYRTIFGIGGAYLAARLAPSEPMKHALWFGGIGLVFCTVGVIAAMTHDLGPAWYSIALLLITLPCSWAGGALYVARTRQR